MLRISIPYWINEYMSVEFEDVGRGEKCDCWGLVRRIMKEQYGIDLPSYDSYECVTEKERLQELINGGRVKSYWEKLDSRDEQLGDVVLFKMQGVLCHVGFCLGGGYMVHTQKLKNCCIEDYRTLRWNRRVHSFYRHVDMPLNNRGLPNE